MDGDAVLRATLRDAQSDLTASTKQDPAPQVANIDTPVLHSIRGILKNVTLDDYHKRLAAKDR